MQQFVSQPNQPELKATLQEAHSLLQTQKPAVWICSQYPHESTQIRSHRRNNDLLKPLKITSVLTPYEHFFEHSFNKTRRLISEKSPGEPNPLIQPAIDSSHTPTRPGESKSNFHTVHTPYVPAPHDLGQHNQVCIESIFEIPSITQTLFTPSITCTLPVEKTQWSLHHTLLITPAQHIHNAAPTQNAFPQH